MAHAIIITTRAQQSGRGRRVRESATRTEIAGGRRFPCHEDEAAATLGGRRRTGPTGRKQKRPARRGPLRGQFWPGLSWWTAGGSNSRPPRCERGALPAELAAHSSTHPHAPCSPARANRKDSTTPTGVATAMVYSAGSPVTIGPGDSQRYSEDNFISWPEFVASACSPVEVTHLVSTPSSAPSSRPPTTRASSASGIPDSFDGLLETDRPYRLTHKDVTGILRLGGTILGHGQPRQPLRRAHRDVRRPQGLRRALPGDLPQGRPRRLHRDRRRRHAGALPEVLPDGHADRRRARRRSTTTSSAR